MTMSTEDSLVKFSVFDVDVIKLKLCLYLHSLILSLSGFDNLSWLSCFITLHGVDQVRCKEDTARANIT